MGYLFMTSNEATKDFIEKVKNGEFDIVDFDNEELDLTNEFIENSNKEYKESLSSMCNEILK